MPSYVEWNDAIILFLTRNVPKGTPVYLTINEAAIWQVGRTMSGSDSEDNPYEDFLLAVKEKCIRKNLGRWEVCLEGLEGLGGTDDEPGFPRGIAFLSLMVLAAHNMSSQGGIDHTNYFKRLRLLLGLGNDDGGRPEGLKEFQEKFLWRSWNMWLETKGWEATAELGPEGPMKYINYPIGQALLRDDDVEYLKGQFQRELLNPRALRSLDESQLGGWLLRQRINRRHLRAGLESTDPARASAFFDEAYKVYQSMDWEQENEGSSPPSMTSMSTKIVAGLLCQPSMRGGFTYKLFPRIPAQWQGEQMVARLPDGKVMPLEQYRPGLFRPLSRVAPFNEEAQSFTVEGSDNYREIVLPSRSFWVLTRDPEDPSGAMATWDKYSSLMGKKFLLIVAGGINDPLAQQVMSFREHGTEEGGKGLIDWDRGPVEAGGWTEFHGCMVLSAAWDSIIPSNDGIELYEALKPAMRATVALSGGLRAPAQGAWIEGFPPSVTIYGFEKGFRFRVEKADETLYEENKFTQSPFSLERCMEPGLYRLEVLWGSRIVAGKTLRIIGWEKLESSPIETQKGVCLGPDARICGARIVTGQEDDYGC